MTRQIKRGTFLLTLSFILSTQFVDLPAQPFSFTNFTHKGQITDMAFVQGELWVSTSGGVVLYEPGSGQVRAFINTDGLRSNDIRFVAPASGGDLYFGSGDGVLIRRNDSGFQTWQLQSSDGVRLSLNAADTSGDFLWIAGSAGVSKFDRFRFGGEVRETYRTLGGFQSESDIIDIVIFRDRVFAATSDGLASAEHQNEFLLDPTEWTTFTLPANGLEASSITRLEVFKDQLFVGTNAGLFLMMEDGTFERQALTASLVIHDLFSTASELYIVARGGGTGSIWEFTTGEQLYLQAENEFLSQINQVAFGDEVYFGSELSGIHRVVGDEVVSIEVDGPASNDLVGGGLTSAGDLYAVSRRNDVSLRRAGAWEHISVTSSEKLAGIVTRDGDLWIASFGNGAYRIKSAGEVEQFNYLTSPLIGVAQSPAVSVVNGLYEDAQGNIWFSLFQASPFRPMVMFDPSDSVWAWWDAGSGLVSGNNQVIAGGSNTAAIGVDDQGVAFLRYGADPFNPNDDVVAYYNRRNFLPTNIVTALAYDRDDILWVGTGQGLSYFDSDIDIFFSQPLPDGVSSVITAIVADSRNNLWVGTTAGLALVSAAGGESRSFTTGNSDLISDEIESLSYNENSNQLVIFTGGGLSLLNLDVGDPGETGGVYAYPNPFRIRLGEVNRLAFSLDQRGDVKILTVAGDLVHSTTVNAGWDGRNDSGELVASGVYLFHIRAEDGSSHVGKIFVIRR